MVKRTNNTFKIKVHLKSQIINTFKIVLWVIVPIGVSKEKKENKRKYYVKRRNFFNDSTMHIIFMMNYIARFNISSILFYRRRKCSDGLKPVHTRVRISGIPSGPCAVLV